MTAQELQLDYFMFYDAANQGAGYVIGLQGQFDKQPERAQLTYLNLFANPTSKNGEPIYDKNAHLTWYDMYDPSPDPTREVTYENQFGKHQVIIGRSYAFLSPTWKVERGSSFPDKLDHYRVYQVLQGDPVGATVKLDNQFGSLEARVYYPRFFAVPCRKYWEGQTFGIHNDKAHLVLYIISPASVQKTIQTRDQFSPRYLNVFRSVLLAAPSTKLAWKEISRPVSTPLAGCRAAALPSLLLESPPDASGTGIFDTSRVSGMIPAGGGGARPGSGDATFRDRGVVRPRPGPDHRLPAACDG